MAGIAPGPGPAGRSWGDPSRRGAFLLAIAGVDPSGPPPRRGAAGGFPSPRWPMSAGPVGCPLDLAWLDAVGAVDLHGLRPRIGKTRTVLDLARRAYHGRPWADGHPMTLSAGTVTL